MSLINKTQNDRKKRYSHKTDILYTTNETLKKGLDDEDRSQKLKIRPGSPLQGILQFAENIMTSIVVPENEIYYTAHLNWYICKHCKSRGYIQ